MDAPAIVVDNVEKRFGEVVALAGVSFAVPPATVLGLLGPNGAGKTTAVRILTSILPPDAGQATVLGIDVARHPQSVRLRIGLAGQYAAVDEVLTGRENLRLVGALSHLDRKLTDDRATELLERFGLSDAADRPLKTYSGGMRRRLDLAAALVHRPPVLFLDEPTTGLDPASRLGLWQVIEELVADGTTVLLTTQYLEEADRLADNIVVIDHGRVIAEGTATELKARIGATHVEVTVAVGDEERARAVLAGVGAPSTADAADGIAIQVPGGGSDVLAAVRALDGAGLTVETLAVREPTLDDVFLELTGRPAADGDEPDGDASDVPTETTPETVEVSRSAATVAPLDDRTLARESRLSLAQVGRDAGMMTWRNLVHLRRNPELLVFATIQPIIFVLMFVYVFGGAIKVPGASYVDFLMAGVWIQSVTFGALNTGVGLAEDLQAGLIERFRSLPMARSAVLVGRTTADLVRNVFVVSLMTGVGFLVGFNYHTTLIGLLAGLGLVLLFSYALSWVSALLGLIAPNAETAQAMFFPIVAVLVFASAAFVPVDSMPGWLQGFSRNQPVSVVIEATRACVLGGATATLVIKALLWIAAIVAVFAPLAIRRYRKVS